VKGGGWIRHVVSIAGALRNKATLHRVGGARVEIIEGPPAFHALVEAHTADPAWLRRRERLNQVYSRSDGIYFFLDLPPGPYRLRASVPEMGTRYGTVEIGPIAVEAAPAEGPFRVARADADLPPTRVHGIVTDALTGKPVAAARVRLLGDTAIVKTGDDGSYDLSSLVAGQPALQVTAPRYKPTTRKLELAAGQERVENLVLQPAN
jgi:hypothetical protein